MREDREEVNGKVDRKVAFYRLFSFADRVDIGLMMVGAVSGLANGLAQPLMMLVFGGLVNSFGFSPPSLVVHEVSKVFYFCLASQLRLIKMFIDTGFYYS